MKRLARLLAGLMACMLLIPAPAVADDTTFTLMIYLCGTDLETDGDSASMDLLEMMEADIRTDGALNVVIQTGGTLEWGLEGIDPEVAERWVVNGEDIDWLEGIGAENMGDARTLSDFVEFSVDTYPADRYGLILWDHGGGSTSGVCFDEITNDYLTLEAIHDALGAVSDGREEGFYLDFIGFDACLMATFEMANYVKPYAEYMIASEELAPANGFDYTALLTALSEDPAIPTLDLLQQTADAYMDTNLAYDPDDYLTISVLDLTRMDALTSEIEGFGEGLSEALSEGDLRSISRERQNMRSFGDFSDAGSDMVDLLAYARRLADVSGREIASLEHALADVVVHNRYTEEHLDNICGLSILMPLQTRATFDTYFPDYDPLDQYPYYSAFLSGYTDLMNGGSYVFSPETPRETTGWQMLMALGEQVTVTGQDFQAVVDQIDEAEVTDEDAFGEDGFLTYAVSLTADDMEHLAYVEGNLMIDISDDEIEAYVDLGYLQHAVIDWDNDTVYSLFDGTWPMLSGQLVHMTDQVVTERSRRSLVDVTVNGMQVYLLVVFDDANPDGKILGYTEGYNEHGMPARGYEKLQAGDVIVPQYYLYLYDDEGEEHIEAFDGDPIEYDGQSLAFEYVSLADGETSYAYTFCLNDIFGEYQFTDFLFFDL